VSGSGFAVGSAFSAFEATRAVVAPNADVTFDASGRFTSYTAGAGSTSISATLQPAPVIDVGPAGVPAEANNMDGLAWGRWTGSVQNCTRGICSIDVYSPNQGFHYVIGTPTPVMPTSGTGTYVLLTSPTGKPIGATQPTYTDGRTTPGTFTGTLQATFAPTGTDVKMNLNVSMSDNRNYAIGGSTGPMSGSTISGTASNLLGTQSGPLTITAVTGSAAGTCACGCQANVQGFFAGAKAERAGIAYHINDFSPGVNANISGAAAFKKTP